MLGAFVVTTVAGAVASDRFGRKRIVVLGNGLAIAIGLAVFPILDVGTAWAFGLDLALVLGVVGVAYRPIGAQLPELFATRYRFTGAGTAYNLAGVLGGAVTPLLATLLVPQFGGFAVGLYLAFVAVVSTVASLLVHETRHADLAAEPVGAARV